MTQSTLVLRRAGEGPSHSVLGMAHEYKLLASESGGHFMAFIITVPPGCGAPMHAHDRESESFFLLEGEITARFPDGGHAVARPGDYVWFGVGQAHSFANEGTVPARALVVQSPGLEAECFFNEMADRGTAPLFDPAQETPEVGARYGIQVMVPATA